MSRDKIVLERPERFSKPHTISREKLEAAAKAATDKLEKFILDNGMDFFPGTCSRNFKYKDETNCHWEAGMWTGCMWLAYELTGKEIFKQTAERHLPTYKKRVDELIGMDDHDVGFVFSPACVAAYKLTGNEDAKKYALEALDYYFKTSYSHEGKFIIRLWKLWDSGEGCRTMMDSLFNAPFLFWSSEVTGDPQYAKAALDHVRTTEQYLVRKDGSTYHHYQFDPKTAGPVRGVTWQGHSDESCWSRGHSWGVYGFPIAYSYAKEQFIADVHKDITYFMLNHLPEDLIPYWDYDYVSGLAPRDASAGAVAVCGMLEMCKMLPDDAEQKAVFESASAQMLEAIIDLCTGDFGHPYDGLIHHVSHAIPQGYGFDECAIYGDFFYLEALARYLKPDFKKYW